MAEYTGEVLKEQPNKAPTGATPSPTPIVSGAETAAKFEEESAEQRTALEKSFEKSKKETATTPGFTLEGLLTSPPAMVAGGAVLGYLGAKAAPVISEGVTKLKDRWINKSIDTTPRIEPVGFDFPVQNFPETAPTVAPQIGQTNLTPEDLQAKLASMQQAPAVGPVAPGPIVRSEFPAAPVNPAMFSSSPKAPLQGIPPSPPTATPLTAAPGAPAPIPSAAPNSSATGIVADTIKELIDETPSAAIESPPLQTGTGKPAFAGQGPAAKVRPKGKLAGEPMLRNSYAKIEDVPAGYAFVPGAQNIDTSRANIGQEEYTKAYSQRPFPLTNEAAVLESSEINRILGRPTRPEAKAAGITLPPQTPGVTKAVLESKASPFMGTKAAKVGGVLGALIAIPDLAKAETVGQRGMAGANLLEAVLPPGFTMTGAGEGSANVPSMNAAMLLGSPYAQSDFAKKLRQDQEYTRKVGSGRGIAPPSAYQR